MVAYNSGFSGTTRAEQYEYTASWYVHVPYTTYAGTLPYCIVYTGALQTGDGPPAQNMN